MSDPRLVPTIYHGLNGRGPGVRTRPTYDDVGNGWSVCGWCSSALRTIDTSGHTHWHWALADYLWELREGSRY